MTSRLSSIVICVCALALVGARGAVTARAEQVGGHRTVAMSPIVATNWESSHQHPTAPAAAAVDTWGPSTTSYQLVQAMPTEDYWITSPEPTLQPGAADEYVGEPAWNDSIITDSCQPEPWFWQVLPDGLIYH